METLALEQIIEIDNYRTDYSDLDSLVANMRAKGFNPEYAVTVMPLDAYTVKSRLPMYALVKGHRRTRSARLAGLVAIPCHIQTGLTPVARKLDQLAENENRSNPNPMDQANGFQQAIDLGASIADLVLHTGHKQPYIEKRLALLTLTSEAQRLVASKHLSIDYAHELTRLKPEYQGAALAAYHRATRCDLTTFKEIVSDLYTKQVEAEHTQLPMFGGELEIYIETAVQTIEANRQKTRAELEAELAAVTAEKERIRTEASREIMRLRRLVQQQGKVA